MDGVKCKTMLSIQFSLQSRIVKRFIFCVDSLIALSIVLRLIFGLKANLLDGGFTRDILIAIASLFEFLLKLSIVVNWFSCVLLATIFEADDIVIECIHTFIHHHRLCLNAAINFSVSLGLLILFKTCFNIEQRRAVNSLFAKLSRRKDAWIVLVGLSKRKLRGEVCLEYLLAILNCRIRFAFKQLWLVVILLF